MISKLSAIIVVGRTVVEVVDSKAERKDRRFPGRVGTSRAHPVLPAGSDGSSIGSLPTTISSHPAMSSPDLTSSSLFDVKGKVVLCTGGSSGIGFMMSAAFVASGAKGDCTILLL